MAHMKSVPLWPGAPWQPSLRHVGAQPGKNKKSELFGIELLWHSCVHACVLYIYIYTDT